MVGSEATVAYLAGTREVQAPEGRSILLHARAANFDSFFDISTEAPVGGEPSLGTSAQFSGVILSKTLVSMNTGATLLGRAFAFTEVTLNQNAVTEPT